MSDQRYLVYKTEPNDHYASLRLALEKAQGKALADEGTTYLVRQATVYDVSEVDTAPVTTIVRDRWDSWYEGWHLDEVGSSTTRDSISGSHDFLALSMDDVAGRWGRAARFWDEPSFDSSLQWNGNDFRPSSLGSFTLSFWIKPLIAWDNANTWAIIRAQTDWEVGSTAAELRSFGVRDGTTATLHTSLIDIDTVDTWYFVVCQWDSATRQVRAVVDADTTKLWEPAMPNVAQSTSTAFSATHVSPYDTEFALDEMHFFQEVKSDPWIVDQWREGVGRLYPENK